MKKLILFLALFISVIADGQVVVPKSTTTFSNVRATGSMTVANKLRVGSTTAPSATLDVTGTMNVSSTATLSSTLKLGSSAVLTGGNTGTVAVLSDAVFCISFNGGAYSPADGAITYNGVTQLISGASANGTITLPYNCTLVGWNYNAGVNGTIASAETATIALNYNGSDYVLSSAITYSNATGYNSFSGSGLSQNFTAGDRINFKTTFPTFVTNPTSVYQGIIFYFIRRS